MACPATAERRLGATRQVRETARRAAEEGRPRQAATAASRVALPGAREQEAEGIWWAVLEVAAERVGRAPARELGDSQAERLPERAASAEVLEPRTGVGRQ